MTCAHVLGLIDAGPFADFSRAHLEAAWQHARQCATCGPALAASTALTRGLEGLAQPGPSPDLTAIVMARVARIEPAGHSRVPGAIPATTAPANTPDWSAGATALGSLAAGLAVVLAKASGGPSTIEIASPGGIATGLLAMPAISPWALALAAGLGLYAAGLFAPLGRKGPP